MFASQAIGAHFGPNHAGFSYVVTILPQFRHCRLRMMLPSGRWRV